MPRLTIEFSQVEHPEDLMMHTVDITDCGGTNITKDKLDYESEEVTVSFDVPCEKDFYESFFETISWDFSTLSQ